MYAARINRLSGKAILLLALVALVTVLTGYFQPPQPDEGALAHVFQLSIVMVMMALLVFLFTADWKRPLRAVRELRRPGIALAAAFVALYFLEHR